MKRYLFFVLFLGLNVHAGQLHGVEVESYAKDEVVVSITVDRASALAEKLTSAMTQSQQMRPVELLKNTLTNNQGVSFQFSGDHTVHLDLKLDMSSPRAHYKVTNGAQGIAVYLDGPLAEKLREVLWESTSKSVISVKNPNGIVAIDGEDVAVLEGDLFGGTEITCFKNQNVAESCQIILKY